MRISQYTIKEKGVDVMFLQCVAYISRALGSTDCTSGETRPGHVVSNSYYKDGTDWSKLFRNASACALPKEGCRDVEPSSQRSGETAKFVRISERKRGVRFPSELSNRSRTSKIASSSQPGQNSASIQASNTIAIGAENSDVTKMKAMVLT